MMLRPPASAPVQRPAPDDIRAGDAFVKHPPFDNAPVLLRKLNVKVFLVLAPDENGAVTQLVGIRLSLSSARLVSDRYPGAEIHRFLATK